MLIRTYVYFKEDEELDKDGNNTTTREVNVYFDTQPDMFPMVEYWIEKYNPYLIQVTDYEGDVLMYCEGKYRFNNIAVKGV